MKYDHQPAGPMLARRSVQDFIRDRRRTPKGALARLRREADCAAGLTHTSEHDYPVTADAFADSVEREAFGEGMAVVGPPHEGEGNEAYMARIAAVKLPVFVYPVDDYEKPQHRVASEAAETVLAPINATVEQAADAEEEPLDVLARRSVL